MRTLLVIGLSLCLPTFAFASVELCSELMVESYELEEFESFLDQWEVIGEDHGGIDSLTEATTRVSKTSKLISKDVFSNKYERELARSVTDAASDVEVALEDKDVKHLYPAYEVLMETIDYLTGACFTEPETESKSSTSED